MFRRCMGFFAAATKEAASTPAESADTKKSWFRNHVIVKRQGGFRSRWGRGDEGVNSGTTFNSAVKLHCVDNSNCKHARIIANAAHPRFAHCRVMPVVAHRVSVMRFKSGRGASARQRVKPGTIYWGIIFTKRGYQRRWSGLITNFDKNTCVIMNDQKNPIGTRVMYVAGRHVNHRVHLKAAVMANFFV